MKCHHPRGVEVIDGLITAGMICLVAIMSPTTRVVRDPGRQRPSDLGYCL